MPFQSALDQRNSSRGSSGASINRSMPRNLRATASLNPCRLSGEPTGKVGLGSSHALSRQISISGTRYMMLTAAELEEIIARTPAGERIVYDGREIGSTDGIAEKLKQLKISRS